MNWSAKKEKQSSSGTISRLFGDLDPEEWASKASPVSHASAEAPPFLIIHGTRDATVPISQGDRLNEALEKAGAKHVEYLRYNGSDHGVFNKKSKETKPALAKFFEETLAKKKDKMKDQTKARKK